MEDREIRSYDFTQEELRYYAPHLASDNTVEGYAIVFNTPSRTLTDRATRKRFTEIIEPRAVSKEFLDRQDIRLNYNHDDTQLLGRSLFGQGTLRYEVDEKGVKYTCELPDTTLGRDVRELIRRGDLFGCSFAFTYASDGVRDEREAGRNIRRVSSFGSISDFSIVCNPAYWGTSVVTRSFDAPEEEAREETPKQEPAPEPQPSPEEVNATAIGVLDGIDWKF